MTTRDLTPEEVEANVRKTVAEADSAVASAEQSRAAAREHDSNTAINRLI